MSQLWCEPALFFFVQFQVQWWLINHFIQATKLMFPQMNMLHQQYFLFPSQNMPFSPFFNGLNQGFIMPPSHLQNGLNYFVFGQNLQAPGQNGSFMIEATQFKENTIVQTQQRYQTKDIKNLVKEKLIKKLANRPATYLTERKFYLAQKLPEESHAPRKLRQRNLKTKINKTSQSSSTLKQDILPVINQPLGLEKKNNFPQQEESPAFEISKQQPSQLLASLNQEGAPTMLRNEKRSEIVSQSDASS